jgi:hypothetical protein
MKGLHDFKKNKWAILLLILVGFLLTIFLLTR